MGNLTTYAYGPSGQVASVWRVIDGRNSTLTYDYYGPGEASPQFLLKQRGISLPGGQSAYTTYSYDGASNLTQVTDADLKSMSYLYSPVDRLLSEVDSLGRRSSYGYDNRGNLILSTDPLQKSTAFLYDGVSQQTGMVDPLGNRTTFGYDLAGSHNLFVDAEGAQTHYHYSPGRDLVARIDPVDGTTSYNSDMHGRLSYLVDPASRMVSYGYDRVDRVKQLVWYPTPSAPQATNLSYTPRGEVSTRVVPTGERTSYAYYGNGPLQSVLATGQSGPAVTGLTYTSHKAVKSHTDALGNQTQHFYDEAGRCSFTSDALGHRTTYLYTAAGDLAAVVNARGARVSYTYDELHRPRTRVESPAPGVVYTWTTEYDDAGRVQKKTYPDGSSMVYGYFDNGWLQFQVDPMGFRTSYTYNNRGQVRTQTDAEGRVTTHNYDDQGRPVSVIDPAGFITSYGYDLSGNQNMTMDPLGNTVTHVYDGAHRLSQTQVSPQPGLVYVTGYQYDGSGRLVQTTFPDNTSVGYSWLDGGADGYRQETDELGRIRTFSWDKVGNALSAVDPNSNHPYLNHYDALNRVLYTQKERAIQAAQASVSFAYDEVSNQVAAIDALGHRHTTYYDLLNRVTTRVRSAGGGVLLTEYQDYDARGNLLFTQDARGLRYTHFYDANSRLIAVQDPLGAFISYSYDRTGRRTQVQHPTTAAGPAYTTFMYDPRGLLTTLVHADGSVEQYGYDGAGRRTGWIQAGGRKVSFAYDNMGRQISLIPHGGEAAVFQGYDSRSRRIWRSDGFGETVFGYYADGRLRSVQDPHGALTYSYDPGGRRTSLAYAAGVVTYGCDRDNNLVSVLNPWNELTQYAWDLAERLTTITLANGSIVSHRYDDADRLVYKGDPNPASGIGFLYGLDLGGNRVTITENDGSQTVNAYDLKNRLLSEVRTGVSPYACQYGYDQNSNLTARDLPGGGRVTFTLDKAGKITSDTAGTAYSYDPDGRLLSRTGGIGTVTFAYDYAGRAVGMSLNNGAATLVYLYDGDGRQQVRWRDGVRTDFLLDGKDVLREWVTSLTSATGTPGSFSGIALRPRELPRALVTTSTYSVVSVTQDYIDYTHGLGLISQRTSLASDFFRWDGRATSRRLEDGGRGDARDTVFDAYGLSRGPTLLTSAYGFVGEEGVRGEKGLSNVPYHMRARMYDPLLGRFTSRDPVWGSNLYEYGKGNPWSLTDPDGQKSRLLPPDKDPTGKWERFLAPRGYERFGFDSKMKLLGLIDQMNRLFLGATGDEKLPMLELSHHELFEVWDFWKTLFEAQKAMYPPDIALQHRAGVWLETYKREHPNPARLDWSEPSPMYGAADLFTGWGDALTVDITQHLRKPGVVDPSKGWYKLGQMIGAAHGAAIGKESYGHLPTPVATGRTAQAIAAGRVYVQATTAIGVGQAGVHIAEGQIDIFDLLAVFPVLGAVSNKVGGIKILDIPGGPRRNWLGVVGRVERVDIKPGAHIKYTIDATKVENYAQLRDNQYDVVFMNNIRGMKVSREVLEELGRRVKRGGLIIVQGNFKNPEFTEIVETTRDSSLAGFDRQFISRNRLRGLPENVKVAAKKQQKVWWSMRKKVLGGPYYQTSTPPGAIDQMLDTAGYRVGLLSDARKKRLIIPDNILIFRKTQ